MPAHAPVAASGDVAAIIPERVLDPGGDFGVNTNPTQAQVQSVIAAIIEEVQVNAGALIDDTLAAYATLTVATGAAAQVELAFTNDLSTDAQSKYAQLWAQYQTRLKWLDTAQQVINQGGSIGERDPRDAQFTLPLVNDPLQPMYPYTQAREQF